MDLHLGRKALPALAPDDHPISDSDAPKNRRNGHSPETVRGELGELTLDTPRDRRGTFEPQLIPKHQRRLTGFDEKILALYAKGLTTRDIHDIVQELYGVDVSPTLISEITADLGAEVTHWRQRRLDPVWPIVSRDGLVVHVRGDNARVTEHTMDLAIGVNLRGKKELLGLWLGETEGAKFWLSCLTDVNNRGLKDIFIACGDGLTGFPEAIRTAIYTTDAIESVNSVIRKDTRNREQYPNAESALKLVSMASHEASKRWTMPIVGWKAALNPFAIMFAERMPGAGKK
jgi:putative transposase